MKNIISLKWLNALTLFIAITSTSISAQNDNDLEGWSAVELNLKATKKLSFSVAEHLRFRNDISTVKITLPRLK